VENILFAKSTINSNPSLDNILFAKSTVNGNPSVDIMFHWHSQPDSQDLPDEEIVKEKARTDYFAKGKTNEEMRRRFTWGF
jgi:hypothetical protein